MQQRLKLLRKELGLTQADFASKLNIKRGTIAAYEVGQEVPDRAIADMVRVYGVNESWLRTGEGEMFPVPADSSGDEFAEYAQKLMDSNAEIDQWTKEMVVRWCKLTPERQRIFIRVLYDLFADDEKQKEIEKLFPFV